jgi:phosphatidate phosphatase APP1
MLRALAVATILVPSAVAALPSLLVPPALGRTDAVWIAGRALRERPRTDASAPVNNAWALAAPNWEGADVEVLFLGRRGRAVTGHDGEFEIELRAEPGKPFPPGRHAVAVRIPGVAAARSVVHVVPPEAPFLVVSDFDDTVAVTHVASKRKVLATAFLHDGDTQPAVGGMAALYRCVAEASGAGAVAFVSGSPVQFAPRVSRFLERTGFPPAALHLRNLGRGTLHGYKEPVLARLAERFPQPFVLVGDSGERDPEIYAAFQRERPGRVLATYIRRAGEPGAATRYEGMRLFSDPAEVLADLQARRLVDAERCAAPARGDVPTATP